MKILVTGSAGHLGEALMRSLPTHGHSVYGVDIQASPHTDAAGSIVDRAFVRDCLRGIDAVLHTATLHKPHVATHSRQEFVDTNITGTLNLLEEAVAAGVRSFVFTSTTSAFGDALSPPRGAPAAWITERTPDRPKNIYGVTKTAAENLCELFRRNCGLPVLVLRTSRFFNEADDHKETRLAFADANIKANEFLYRRVDLEDVVSAHVCALERAPELGFGKFIISATTPFNESELAELRRDAAAVLARHCPDYLAEYQRRGWRMFDSLDRVYVNRLAREQLGWQPRHDFAHVLASLKSARDPRSPLAQAVGAKGYHDRAFDEGPYPVE